MIFGGYAGTARRARCAERSLLFYGYQRGGFALLYLNAVDFRRLKFDTDTDTNTAH